MKFARITVDPQRMEGGVPHQALCIPVGGGG